MEYLDILDGSGNKTGETISYDDAHEKGIIHKSVHVWILNNNNEILLQKREKNRRAYPGFWDISASGHISAGQISVEAAQMETEEELGITVTSDELKLLFTLEEHVIINNGTYVNNEFQDIYLVKKDLNISDIRIQPDEVEAVKFVSIEDFKKMIDGTDDSGERLVPHEEEYKLLFDIIKQCSPSTS